MILMIAGFHTMVLMIVLQYGVAVRILKRALDSHPDVYVKRDKNGIPGRVVGDYTYYDILFKRKYFGISFELRMPNRRLPYMSRLSSGSGDLVVSQKTFRSDDTGLNIPPSLPCCSLRARVNLKLLSGIADYLTPASSIDIPAVIDRFNASVKMLSPTIKPFDGWKIIRLDYCLNIDLGAYALNEAENPWGTIVPVDPMDYITLIRMGRSPQHSHMDEMSRNAGNNAYWVNKSVRLNIYWKDRQLSEEFPNGVGDVHLPTDSAGILRIEVQYYPNKMRHLRHELGCEFNPLTDELSLDTILKYWRKVVGMSDWFSMAEAKRLVCGSGKRRDRVDVLIRVLDRVSKCRGITAAREKLAGSDLITFDRGLADLEKMGINPVTIPTERGLKHLKNPVRVLLEYDQSC